MLTDQNGLASFGALVRADEDAVTSAPITAMTTTTPRITRRVATPRFNAYFRASLYTSIRRSPMARMPNPLCAVSRARSPIA